MNAAAGSTPSDKRPASADNHSTPAGAEVPHHGKLSSLLRRLVRRSEAQTAAAPKNPVAWRKLQVNLSGTRIAVADKAQEHLRRLSPGPNLRIERCEIIGQPISYQDADFKIDVVANNLTFSQAAADDPRRRGGLDFDDGHVTLRVAPADAESLLKTLADQFLRPYHVTLSTASVRFRTPTRRQLQVDLRVTAKRRFLWASLHLRGKLVVHDDLQVSLSHLEVHGVGGLGRIIAAWVKPRLPGLQAQKFALAPPSFAGARPRDIAFTTGETLDVQVAFESTSVVQNLTNERASLPAMNETIAKTPTRKLTADRRAGRLDIFIIDTGWNEPAKQALDDHLKMFETFLADHLIYVLDQEQSSAILSKSPRLIGEDPILAIVNSDARIEAPKHGYGVRLCLGAMPADRLSDHLRTVLQIASDRSRTTSQIIRQLRKECHKKGLDGAVEIVGEMLR